MVAAAAAAKSLQLCPTPCDTIDRSLPEILVLSPVSTSNFQFLYIFSLTSRFKCCTTVIKST